MSLATTVVMQLELILKYFKAAFKAFKVFIGHGLHHITTSTGGLSETGNKAISASIEIEVELRLSLAKVKVRQSLSHKAVILSLSKLFIELKNLFYKNC